MPKPLVKLTVRLPEYRRPRNAWRREIHRVVSEGLEKAGIRYKDTDRLEIAARLYFQRNKLRLVDIDNRLKDILDALQGHVGGAGKRQRTLKPLIPNDSQVFRVIVEKGLPPKQSKRGRGHLFIRKYKGPIYR
jgi:Holliday junction resolvase RusA-like endonuclease